MKSQPCQPLLAAVVLTLLLAARPAWANPFTSGQGPGSSSPSLSLPGLLPMPTWFRELQRDLHREIARALQDPEQGLVLLGWVVLLGVAYGALHSLLPGHQKGLVVAFFLAKAAPAWHALWTALLFGLAHLVSSLLLYGSILALSALTEGLMSLGEGSEVVGGVFQRLSALGMLGVGGFLLWETFRAVRQGHGACTCAHHGHEERPEELTPKRYLGLLLVAALTPCPGTMLVLLFAFSLGVPILGLAALLGISVGVALVLGLLALLTILARQHAWSALSTRSLERLAVVFQASAALFVVASSVVLLA